MCWRVLACLVVVSCGGGTLAPGAADPPLADLLARTWINAGSSGGDCTYLTIWYTFGADGSLIERDIDDNRCYGPQVLDRPTGAYTLRDRVLEMTLNGLGRGTQYLRFYTYPMEPVARFVERSPIMIGKLAASSPRAGLLAIDDAAYTSTDGAHYQSPRYVRMDSAAGTRLFEREMTVDVTVDPPLPLAVGQTCRVQVDFSLVLFEPAAPVSDERDTFRLTYDAIIRVTEPGWVRLMPRPIDGLSDAEAYDAWQAVLEQAGLSTNHSARFAGFFQQNSGYYLSHPANDPHLLTQGLPGSGSWLEPIVPPPIE